MLFESFFQDGEMEFKYGVERGFRSGYMLFDSLDSEKAFAQGEGGAVSMLLVSVGGATMFGGMLLMAAMIQAFII